MHRKTFVPADLPLTTLAGERCSIPFRLTSSLGTSAPPKLLEQGGEERRRFTASHVV